MLLEAIEVLNRGGEVEIAGLLCCSCDEQWREKDIFRKVVLDILRAEERLYWVCVRIGYLVCEGLKEFTRRDS